MTAFPSIIIAAKKTDGSNLYVIYTSQHLKNEDKEYLPSDDGSDSDDVDFDEEGVAEGKDSVLIQKVEVGDKMDTIAKYAHHNYYLRSLDKPDSFPITTAPLPLLQGPPGPANSIRGVQGTMTVL